METIKLGSKGDAVKTLQVKLGLAPDGVFGNMTDAAVRKFQVSHGLKADGIVGNATWEALGVKEEAKTVSNDGKLDQSVRFMPLKVHIGTAQGRKIKYLVIHYTAGGSSKVGSAARCFDIFNKREASADFAVDDVEMVQFNPDPSKHYCWAVGDGRGKNGIWNKDCISIEICSNLKKGTSASKPNHDGWYFTEESLNNAAKLAKMIIAKYGINIDHVVRHYDVTGKLCPGIIGWNKGAICATNGDKTGRKSGEEAWLNFKKRLA